MGKRIICPVALKDIEFKPFSSVEEVWFWFCRLMSADYNQRGDGDYLTTARPCEVNDIYLIIKALMAKNLINLSEYKTMVKYGQQNQEPDTRFGAKPFEVIVWKRVIAILSEPLKNKGIVEV